MRGFTPVFRCEVGGQNASSGFYSRLVSATLRDEEEQASDTLTIELDDKDNAIILPAKGTKLQPSLGYLETGLVAMGTFEVQSCALKGSGDGEFVTIQAKGANMLKDEKASGRESFHDKTFGDIAREVAKRMGVEVSIATDLASVKIPYVARVAQSSLDFLTRLADRNGGVVKRAGGKLIITKRGSAASATGKGLAPIIIVKGRDVVQSWNVQPDPRPQYGKVQAAWVDQKTGLRKVEGAETGFDGPDQLLRHPFPDQAAAKRAADAEASRLSGETGSGQFVLYGRPEASAGADVIPQGFRPEVNRTWRAKAVEHEFRAGSSGGFTTTVEIKAPEKGKKDS